MRDATGKEHSQNVALTGHEEYFSNSYYLHGSQTKQTGTLPPGEHIFPFSYMLPPMIPSS